MIKFFIIFIEVYGKTCRLNMVTFFLLFSETKQNEGQCFPEGANRKADLT